MGWTCPGSFGLGAMLATLALGGACNFDSAFQRYCQNNPHCQADAATGPEAGPEAAWDTGPEADPEAGPEAGPEVGPEVEPDSEIEVGPPWGPGRDGGPEGQGPIRPPKSCGPSFYCTGPYEICHPFGQVCMTPCRTSADCPSWLDTCEAIIDPGGAVLTSKVCQCSSSDSCDSYASGFQCNPADNLCEPRCHNNSPDCSAFQPPRVCDQFSNFCSPLVPCSSNTDCLSPAQPRCDAVYLRCVKCVFPADCGGRVDGLTECSSTGSCVSPSSS
jgi:hypothetical protein